MKGFSFLIAIAVLVGLALSAPLLSLIALIIEDSSYSYNAEARFRVTIEVQDGDQIKTGSSVIAERFHIFRNFQTRSIEYQMYPTGYAPTVNLGDKGLLFLTFMDVARSQEKKNERIGKLNCPFGDFGCFPVVAYHISSQANLADDRRKEVLRTLLKQRGPRDVPFADLPRLIRIVDDGRPYKKLPPKERRWANTQEWWTLVDQNTVKPDDLAAQFGPGVVLKRVVVELTNDPVTPQPKIWPPWIEDKTILAPRADG